VVRLRKLDRGSLFQLRGSAHGSTATPLERRRLDLLGHPVWALLPDRLGLVAGVDRLGHRVETVADNLGRGNRAEFLNPGCADHGGVIRLVIGMMDTPFESTASLPY
jgi:hypothetical protein